MSITLGGTNPAVTFPDGTIQNTAAVSGVVLQVVQGTYSTQNSTTSGTAVDTGITISITPKFSNSKILVLATLTGIFVVNNGNFVKAQLVRNSTTIGEFAGAQGYTASGGSTSGFAAVNYLDSPATTSSTTYKIQFARNTGSGSVRVQSNSDVSSITLLEIAA